VFYRTVQNACWAVNMNWWACTRSNKLVHRIHKVIALKVNAIRLPQSQCFGKVNLSGSSNVNIFIKILEPRKIMLHRLLQVYFGTLKAHSRAAKLSVKIVTT
jgi:hypothetical protein